MFKVELIEVVHTFSPRTQGQKQEDLYALEASLD